MMCQTVEHLGGSDTLIYTLLLAVFIIVCFLFILFYIITHIKVAVLILHSM
jgi:hypothetical protein